VGALLLPSKFLEFVRATHANMPELVKYPDSEAYKYIFDGALVPGNGQQEGMEILRNNIEQVYGASDHFKSEQVHFDEFHLGKIMFVVTSDPLPIAEKYRAYIKSQQQREQATKPGLLDRMFGRKPGLSKQQSADIKRKIISLAKAKTKKKKMKPKSKAKK
jgi:hypothetical protein